VNAAPDPFSEAEAATTATTSTGAGGEGGGLVGPGGGGQGGDDDPTLGGPCETSADCSDAVPCTVDLCDPVLDRCRFTPDDAVCQDGSFCNGVERCDPEAGCVGGEPSPCGDANACTIDGCDDVLGVCTHAPRDVDQDGDPDVHCAGGGDCDDADPTRSSLTTEICANLKDDDCDGVVDEGECSTATHDTCAEPLIIEASGTYALDTTGAVFDYASSCGLANQLLARDVVAAIQLPPGPPVDVELTARSPWPNVAVTIAGQCGDPFTEIACGSPFPSPFGGTIAKLRARSLGSPSDTTIFPVYVTADNAAQMLLDVLLLPPEDPPTNETCGTATPLVPGVPAIAPLLGTVKDLGGFCAYATGDLVYSFTLDAPQDVHVYATSLDGDGLPSISLRKDGCALVTDEITCQTALSPHIYWASLPAGTYYVGVGATAPTTASVTVEVAPPSPPQPNENCVGAPDLAHNQTISVDFNGHQDDVNLGCLIGAPDVAYTLDLPVTSDVLLVERISQGDVGAIALAGPACDPPSLLVCTPGAPSPLRAPRNNVPAGEYRVVAESLQSKPIQVTAFVRPAVAPVLVPFADGCADAVDIPETGGRFQGTTSNATADFNAGCDLGGVPQGGARDQLLRLVLSSTKRVVFDMTGSGYTTLLDVRQGPDCPGDEVVFGCGIGFYTGRTFLDLVLDAGTYYVQIDGYNQEAGPWFLNVHVVDP
jgi:hypothetical protein